MDKFQAMRAFVRVVETGTFTRASETLDIPKPTVTRLIQTLEADLDTKLLNRTTRKVSPTTDGIAYYERAVRLLNELQEVEGVMTRAKSNPRGRLRVDFPVPIGLGLIIPALPDFVARYPDIKLDFGISDRPLDLMAENIDCVVRTGKVLDQSLVARRLGDVRQVLCATPDYWLKHGRPKHPSGLEHGHDVIQMVAAQTGRAFPIVVKRNEEAVEVIPERTLTANDSTACLAMGLAGLGVVHALTFLSRIHIDSGALEPAFADWWADPISVFVVYPPNRHLSAKVRVFVDWLVELFLSSDTANKPVLRQ
ncbi:MULTISPECIES: LysR family transcriptional regulator [Burkholderiaceae]|uniref:Transcriptional regulator, LysR family n=1 Tax=Caballeronia sordidicola TaxID=196367 RepID=A0A242M333_CABSO|nr:MULTISPECIES: LysR family transcriptional regulator [Burkholderiaceae]AME26920.1 LysR family transcriptional regulator [Burkholderia sp. PAMC 26561]AME27934.1 LysR family transcriptional regulator [Burkholderia sp. PAMC 26561]OTP65554.1 Transcriptional regulator, LysR family [Caballeronia sordidicola]